MWQINKVSGTNFMSFKNIEYDIQQNCVTVIEGDNKDDEGADSNGAGKSCALLIVRMGLLDTPQKDKTKNDYITWGEKECEINITLNNPLHNKKMDIVRRYFSNTKPSQVEVWLNNELQTQLTSVPEANGFIVEQLGISKADLLNYYLIAQENNSFFFSTSDTDKKDIIGRFVGLEHLDEIQESLKPEIKIKKAESSSLTDEIEDLNTTLGDLEESIENQLKIAETDKEKRIKKVKEEIAEIKEEIEEETEYLEEKNRELVKINEFLDTYDVDGYDDIVKELSSTEDKVEKIRDKKQEITDLINENKKYEKTTVSCPKCAHQFSTLDGEVDVEQIKKLLTSLEKLGKKTTVKFDEAKERLASLKDKKSSKDKLKSKYDRVIGQMKSLQPQIDKINSRIKKLKKSLSDKKREKESIEGEVVSVNEEYLTKLKTKKVKTLVEIKKKEREKRQISKEAERLEFWYLNFGTKGFKAHLINKTLSVLEGKINNRFNLFKVNIFVKINGFTKLKGGDVREKIEVLVNRNGLGWKNFSTLSGGQKMRVALTTILVIQDLINSSSPYGGLDFLSLDETFDGLDRQGQKSALKFLEMSKKTILVVSHTNHSSYFSNILKVSYNNGESTIV